MELLIGLGMFGMVAFGFVACKALALYCYTRAVGAGIRHALREPRHAPTVLEEPPGRSRWALDVPSTPRAGTGHRTTP